ncbi:MULTISPECIES: phage tail tip lysozyme [Paraburkholderia]|uniref:phage tail tip lysozyme n=1 Tax=Paraburkholderia TaxID=1822464 RepID=UPI00035D7263|nr:MULTISPECIES: phage tail tip lysozyme [Paraburkholderia]MDH6146237.1 hypothetical protein [Paraburkholderia sp. WSM4179]
MSGTLIQNGFVSSNLGYMNGVDGTDNGSGNSQIQAMEEILQELIQELQQILASQSGSDSDSGGGGGSGGGGPGSVGSGSGSSPSPVSYAATPAATPPSTPPATSPAPGSSGTSGPAPTTSTDESTAPGGLSTAPQTQPLTQQQGQQVAAQYVANLQQDFGLTKPQAEGVVANLWHESGGMNSGINQGGQIGEPSANMADDNANGYGIAQWGGSRKQGLIDYAQQHGLDPSSQAANYGYLKQELETTQSGAIAAVKGTTTAEQATEAFCNAFEKPSDPEMASRLSDLSLVQG